MEEYRLLATGSRRITNEGRALVADHARLHLQRAAESRRRLVIVQGACHLGGADLEFARWGWRMENEGYPVRVESHPAKGHPTEDFGEWPSAGPNRNSYVVGLGAVHCVALMYACNAIYCKRRGVHPSHGAADCARKAEAAGIPTTRLDLWKN